MLHMFNFRLAADAKRAMKLLDEKQIGDGETLFVRVRYLLGQLSACRITRSAQTEKIAALQTELRAANAKLDRMTGNLVQNRKDVADRIDARLNKAATP